MSDIRDIGILTDEDMRLREHIFEVGSKDVKRYVNKLENLVVAFVEDLLELQSKSLHYRIDVEGVLTRAKCLECGMNIIKDKQDREVNLETDVVVCRCGGSYVGGGE